MTVSIADLMRAARNYFVAGALDGPWRIESGVLIGEAGTPLPSGWAAAEGAGVFPVTADGRIDADPLPADRAWDGPLLLLDPPPDFLRLLADVNAWLEARGSEAVNAGAGSAGAIITRRRETFGAYTTDTEYAQGISGSWQAAFADRIAPYRRMFPEVRG